MNEEVKNLSPSCLIKAPPDAKFPDDEETTKEFRLKVKCLAHQSVILARRLIRCLATDLGADPLQFLKRKLC